MQKDPLGLSADTNAYSLVAACCILHSCIDDKDLLSFSSNIDSYPSFACAIVPDHTILDPIAVAAAKFIRFLTEKDAHLTISLNCAIPYDVVRITVSDTDPVAFIPRQGAIVHTPIGNAPAEEDSLTIAFGDATMEDGSL